MMRMRNPFMMSPGMSPYPVDPAFASIGNSLATALVGNPELQMQAEFMRARQGALEASAERDRAAAGVDTQRTAAAAGLPALFAGLVPQAPAAAPGGAPLAGGEMTRLPASTLAEIVGQAAIMTGAQNLDELIGIIASQVGGDELARRGMAGRGVTPGENFALTPERADAISARDAAEAQGQAFGVANIQADASRYGSDRDYQAKVYDTNVDSRTDITTTGMREAGADRRDRLKPLSVDGRIYDQRTGRWITPPPKVDLPVVTEKTIQRDANNNPIRETERRFSAVPAPNAVPVNRIGQRPAAPPATRPSARPPAPRPAANADTPPVRGARKAPDGNWYVETSPGKFARVVQ